jgi:hypothetical protein
LKEKRVHGTSKAAKEKAELENINAQAQLMEVIDDLGLSKDFNLVAEGFISEEQYAYLQDKVK